MCVVDTFLDVADKQVAGKEMSGQVAGKVVAPGRPVHWVSDGTCSPC